MTFELDRLEHTAPDRLEVTGRWFGIRGRRFLRPTLDYEVDGRRGRALALLEHKPWVAEEGEQWTVAFPFDAEQERLAAQLTVGPAMAVALTPGRPMTADSEDGASPPAEEDPDRLRRELAAATELIGDLQEELGASRAEAQLARADVARLEAERDSARGELEGVKRRIEAAQQARVEAVTEADALRAALAVAENERDYTSRERDRALARREEAAAERDRAASGRQTAVEAKRAAEGALSEAMARLDEAKRKPAPIPISAAIEPAERTAGWGARAGALAALCVFGATLLAAILWALL